MLRKDRCLMSETFKKKLEILDSYPIRHEDVIIYNEWGPPSGWIILLQFIHLPNCHLNVAHLHWPFDCFYLDRDSFSTQSLRVHKPRAPVVHPNWWVCIAVHQWLLPHLSLSKRRERGIQATKQNPTHRKAPFSYSSYFHLERTPLLAHPKWWSSTPPTAM